MPKKQEKEDTSSLPSYCEVSYYKDWSQAKKDEYDKWRDETNKSQKEMREMLRKNPLIFGYKKLEDIPAHMLEEPKFDDSYKTRKE